MNHQQYIELLEDRFPTFSSFSIHLQEILRNRDQRTADYSRLGSDYPIAGVLMALTLPHQIIDDNTSPIPHLHLIYEKRAETMKNHPGDIAFPGGTMERVDKDPKEAAYREAYEEVGIDPSALEFVSYLDEFVSSSRILVNPVVAWLPEDLTLLNFGHLVTEKYYPKTKESSATVVMPLAHLLNPNHYRHQPYRRAGKHVGWVRYFDTGEIRKRDHIWGLTASMTRRFLDEIFPDNPLPEEPIPLN